MRTHVSSVTAGVLARSRHLLDLAVQSGDRLYDARSGLLRQTHPTHKTYTGIVVAQTPLEYAIALLATGGSAARANAVIRRTAEFQDRDLKSPTYGNFIWMTHWKAVHDRNAVLFMTPNYAHLWRHHWHQLEPATRACLERVFPLALRGILAHRVPPAYTNISLLNILSKLELAWILGSDEARSDAQAGWDAWVAEVSRDGLAEFNSPCYTAVDLYALEGIVEVAPVGRFRQQAEELLDYVWTEFAANYHAGVKCLTGPMSRAYPSDYLYGNGLSAVIAFQQFGAEVAEFDSNGGLTPFVGNYAIRHYVVSERVRALALAKPWPFDVRGYVPSRSIVWTNHLEREFALGSQTGYYGGQEMPVFLAYRADRKRRTVFFQSTPPIPVLASAQRGGRLLGGFVFPAGTDWAALGPDARKGAVIRLHLGEAAALRGRVRGEPAQGLALRLGRVHLGVCAALWRPDGTAVPVTLEERDGDLVLEWPMGAAFEGLPDGAAPVAAFAMQAEEARPGRSLEAFLRTFGRGALDLRRRRGRLCVAASGAPWRSLVVEIPPRPRRAPAYLHESPALRLRPGKLGRKSAQHGRTEDAAC